VLLADSCIVMEVANYGYGRWHGSSCVILVDCCIIIETVGLHGGSLCRYRLIAGERHCVSG
jgi:hypothetical protein